MKLNIIPQYHPAAALHQPRLWAVMLDDWENLPQRADASYTVTTPKLSYGVPVALDTENDPDGSLGHWSVAYRGTDGKLRVAPFYRRREVKFHDRVIMQNAKWDIRVLQRAKMPVPENIVDTMIAAYCLGLGRQDVKTSESEGDTGIVGGLGLKYLARRHLGFEMKEWKEIKDKPEEVEEYNAVDSVATFLLWEKFEPQLPKHFWTIDMPLLPVIMAMEDRGIMIDLTMLGEFEEHLTKALKDIDLPLNPFSPPQVISYVYGDLGIEPWKFTDSGQPSTAEEVLETIDDPVVKKILEYKSYYKEKGTYVENYVERLTTDGRVHCEFKQCRTATGRLSSARPNLQNVPKEGSEMRKLFVAPEGKKLVRLDYSQLELRVFAAITQDPVMLKAFEEGRDIHQETADATGLTRYQAKTVNFLMLYGGGAWKISREFHIPIDQAKACIARYYELFPAIKKYFAEIKEQVEETKKVYDWFGRMRRMDALYAEDWRIREQGMREAINMPVQGTAAEVVKLAMIDLHEKHNAPLILQVHDELVFEVNEKDAIDYAQWLEEYVPSLVEINGTRFPVEVNVGQNWLESMEEK